MKIEVKRFNQLRCYAPNSEPVVFIELESGADVARLLEKLKVPPDVPLLTIINGRRADEKTPLSSNDKVVLLSPADGG